MATRPGAGQATSQDLLQGPLLGSVLLVTGKEEFLAERAVTMVRREVLAADPDAEVAEIGAVELSRGLLEELSAPSLFSAVRCTVITGLENVSEEGAAAVLEYAAAPAPEVALILMHNGGQKGSGLLTKLRKVDTVREVRSAELKPSEYPGFVSAEIRGLGGAIDPAAAAFLVQAVGADLRSLSAAAHQLTSDFGRVRIGEEQVRTYFGGRAEVKNYAIADAMLAGQRARAFEELRWALETGSSPVYILSAVAAQVRTLANYVAGNRDRSVPEWKLRSLAGQARGWNRSSLGAALQAVAAADAELKGAAGDPAYTMERLILTLASLRN